MRKIVIPDDIYCEIYAGAKDVVASVYVGGNKISKGDLEFLQNKFEKLGWSLKGIVYDDVRELAIEFMWRGENE